MDEHGAHDAVPDTPSPVLVGRRGMGKRGEIAVSHVTAAATVFLVLLVSFASTWQPVHDVSTGIQRHNDGSVAQAAATYVVLTAAFGAGLFMLTSLRFSRSRRRICAAWGVVAALVGLAFLMLAVVFLSLIFFQNTPAVELEPHRLLSRNALDVLPFLTFIAYFVVLAWGLFLPAKPVSTRKRAVRLVWVPIVAATPSALAALWFIWRA